MYAHSRANITPSTASATCRKPATISTAGTAIAAYQELGDRGLTFLHPPRVVSQGEQLELWAAPFRDPDGHALAVTHWEIHR